MRNVTALYGIVVVLGVGLAAVASAEEPLDEDQARDGHDVNDCEVYLVEVDINRVTGEEEETERQLESAEFPVPCASPASVVDAWKNGVEDEGVEIEIFYTFTTTYDDLGRVRTIEQVREGRGPIVVTTWRYAYVGSF